jgi:hypothetical protein
MIFILSMPRWMRKIKNKKPHFLFLFFSFKNDLFF